METVVLTMRGSPRIPRIQSHLQENGISDYRFFYGIHGPDSGLVTTLSYDPEGKHVMHPLQLGCTLSHWMLWNALDFDPNTPDIIRIFEDDVILRPEWKEVVDRALTKLPSDWDMLFPGSCCAGDKRGKEYDSNLFEGLPLCTHFYIVRKKALKTLIETNKRFYLPVDIQLYHETRPHVKSFIIFPRVADQVDTVFPD